MQTIGITGGTGFVGSHLCELLTKEGNKLVIFTRDTGKHSKKDNVKYSFWNPYQGKCDLRFFKELDAMIHLAGAGIADKRWTEKRKKQIVDSRVKTTKFLVEQLKEHAVKCKTLVAASAVGYYGQDVDGKPFEETHLPAKDFLAETCVQWENASQPAEEFVRRVILRFGIILGKGGGPFAQLAKPQQFGFVPILGSGKQVVSWMHIDDLCSLIYQSITDQQFKGAYNAVAPAPVSFKALMQTIARAKGGIKIPFHVPQLLLKIALGEMASEVVKSATVSAGKLQNTGFQFQYPSIEAAVREILLGS